MKELCNKSGTNEVLVRKSPNFSAKFDIEKF